MLRAFNNVNALADAVATEILLGMQKVLPGKRFTIGFPTGRSCANILSKLVEKRGFDGSRLRVVFLDAYCIRDEKGFKVIEGAANPMSFVRRLMESRRNGLDMLNSTHFVIPDPVACDEFEIWVKGIGINLMLLASGSGDGHIAFNSPGAARLTTTRIASLASSTRRDNLRTYRFWKDENDVPKNGVTMGIETIASCSKKAILVLAGEDKHVALTKVGLETKYSPNWPSTIIHECKEGRIYTDMSTLRRALILKADCL